MNKKIRKVKLISRDVLEFLVYYSRFNSLYATNFKTSLEIDLTFLSGQFVYILFHPTDFLQ